MNHNYKTSAKGAELHDLFREIFHLHGALASVQDQVHEKAGLNTSSLKIMKILIAKGPTTVPHIGSYLDVSRQFVQTVCNELLTKAFLESRPNPLHKRSRLMQITVEGQDAFCQAQENEYKIIELALQNIDTSLTPAATELLRNIRGAVEVCVETLP